MLDMDVILGGRGGSQLQFKMQEGAKSKMRDSSAMISELKEK